MNEPIPHFSTISYNFKHRYTEQTIEEIFYWILKGDPKMTEKVKNCYDKIENITKFIEMNCKDAHFLRKYKQYMNKDKIDEDDEL